ncbi:MAG TPA: energy transducer TonB [Pyrinomonadaceae bacterium]|nr:energy transducer TonB [Pyrinomonadaceae bacterium]
MARIVNTFTKKELEFRRALNNFSFKRDATLQSMGMGGQVSGEFRRVSYFTFDNQGNRYEKIVFAPMSSLSNVTQEDIDDLGGINPFALEPGKIDRYDFRYVGKERIDELDLHVFDVTPKVMPDPKKSKERLFTGRVWVDDRDLQIVKTRGKGVPETKLNKYPYVETYREEIDGRYWFPTYSYADEELVFDTGEVLHIRMKVTYSDFVPAHVIVNIREADDQSAAAAKEAAPPASTTSPSSTSPSSVSPSSPSSDKPAAKPIDRSQPVEMGVLNSKAIDLPDPVLDKGTPRYGGKVRVRVIIDETGKVISAEIEDGRIELRRSALEAARKARFPPTLLEGQPVKVTGLLSYLYTQN